MRVLYQYLTSGLLKNTAPQGSAEACACLGSFMADIFQFATTPATRAQDSYVDEVMEAAAV